MIVLFCGFKEEPTVETEGCSCCSRELDVRKEKNKVLEELSENIHVVKEVCEYYGYSFEEFVSQVLSQEGNDEE